MPILTQLTAVVNRFRIPNGLEVKRRTASGTVDKNGEPVESAYILLKVDPIAVHPLTGSDRGLLPAGARNAETLQIFCTQELRTATGGDTNDADILLYPPNPQGPCYEYVVDSVETWALQAGHWRATATRREQR